MGLGEMRGDRRAVVWPQFENDPVYARLDRVLEAIVTRAGGRYVKNPLAGTFMGQKPATAHPLGGCALGEAASTGVVNHKGQLFDPRADRAVYENFYVVDGAVMPGPLGVN